jgi:hypothetical protein
LARALTKSEEAARAVLARMNRKENGLKTPQIRAKFDEIGGEKMGET